MPYVPIQTAARLTGRHRSTLTRAIKRGRLSATCDDAGRFLIDPAELERVFGRLAQATGRGPVQTDAPHRDAHVHASIEDARSLAREVALLREQLDRERAERAREQQGFDDERRFLRGLIESHTEQIRLLSQPTLEPARRRWWWWFR